MISYDVYILKNPIVIVFLGFREVLRKQEGLSLLHKYQVISNLDKSGQSMCVMTSRHSCGEDGR